MCRADCFCFLHLRQNGLPQWTRKRRRGRGQNLYVPDTSQLKQLRGKRQCAINWHIFAKGGKTKTTSLGDSVLWELSTPVSRTEGLRECCTDFTTLLLLYCTDTLDEGMSHSTADSQTLYLWDLFICNLQTLCRAQCVSRFKKKIRVKERICRCVLARFMHLILKLILLG